MSPKEIDMFWENWISRFDNNVGTYITPQNKKVSKETNMIDIENTNKETALNAWMHVRDKIEYSLSKEWKTPQETLEDKVADCEDFTFLLASMFPNLGIKESRMVVGDLIFPDGVRQFHTWNEVDGRIIDATGSIEVVDMLEYDEVESWVIRA